jgi:signal peptidase I
VDAAVALNELKTAYWEYRTHVADQLPEINFKGTLPAYSKQYTKYQQSDGSYTFVQNNSLGLNGEISIDQNIALTILGSAVFAALLSVTVYIMVCGCIGKTASIFGYSVLKVVSGSMEPSIHEGDYIYIKRTDTDSLKAGDIISFYSQDDSIKGEINTHRISEVLSDGTFVTKGDANKIEDSVTVQKVSIIGKYYGKLRFFKWLGSFASTKKLLILFVIIPTVCMAVYEVKTIAEIKIYSNRDEALKAAEEKKEKLMREAVEKEVQRLKMQENEKKEANSFESGKDNEG